MDHVGGTTNNNDNNKNNNNNYDDDDMDDDDDTEDDDDDDSEMCKPRGFFFYNLLTAFETVSNNHAQGTTVHHNIHIKDSPTTLCTGTGPHSF